MLKYSQYIFFLLLYVDKNRELYKLNSTIHSTNTRHSTDLHLPISKLTAFLEGACFRMKVFNHLPHSLKILSNELKQYRPALKQFILTNQFYSLDEYFNWN